MSRRIARGSGFSLIEVIVVIAVISILASMAVPYAVQVIDQSRTEATRKEMEAIQKVIVGDPALGTAGYVGDMGRLPTRTDLRQLNEQLGQPRYPTPFLGVKIGWWGPYLNTGFDADAYRRDEWGTDYRYTPATGRIESAGPDRDFGTPGSPAASDNILSPAPPNTVVIQGDLIVNLHVWNGSTYLFNPQPESATVRFYYSNSGTQSWATLPLGTPPPRPPYTFTGVHSGLHAVLASFTLPSSTAVTGQAVVFVPGNNQQAKLDLYLR